MPPPPPGLEGGRADPDVAALVAQLRGEVVALVESRFAEVVAGVWQETEAIARREEEARGQRAQVLEAKLRACLAEMPRLEAENAALHAEASKYMNANARPYEPHVAPGFPALPHFPVPAEGQTYEHFSDGAFDMSIS